MRPSERSPLSGRGVSEMKPTISTGACTSSVSACATSSMWRAEAPSTRGGGKAGRAQQQPRDPLIDPAGGADDHHGEDEGAVEDVVARVVLAVDHREDQ